MKKKNVPSTAEAMIFGLHVALTFFHYKFRISHLKMYCHYHLYGVYREQCLLMSKEYLKDFAISLMFQILHYGNHYLI